MLAFRTSRRPVALQMLNQRTGSACSRRTISGGRHISGESLCLEQTNSLRSCCSVRKWGETIGNLVRVWPKIRIVYKPLILNLCALHRTEHSMRQITSEISSVSSSFPKHWQSRKLQMGAGTRVVGDRISSKTPSQNGWADSAH